MKKNKFLPMLTMIGLLSISSISAFAFASNYRDNYGDLFTSTEDYFNEKEEIEKINVKRAFTTGALDCSRVYSQVGSDGVNTYLRFAVSNTVPITNLVNEYTIAFTYAIDDKTYTLDLMTKFVKRRLDEITKINLYDIGLSEEELKRPPRPSATPL